MVAEAVVAAHPEGLPEVHQVVRRGVPDPEVLLHPVDHVVQACQVVLGLEVPFYLVMDPPDHPQLSRSLGSLGQMGSLLNPITLVRVRVPVFWEVPALVGFAGPLLVGTAGGAVATMGQSPVETIPSTRWSLPWRKGRNRGPLVVVSPSGSMFVGLAGACWRVMVIRFVQGSGRLLFVQRLAVQSLLRPRPESS